MKNILKSLPAKLLLGLLVGVLVGLVAGERIMTALKELLGK